MKEWIKARWAELTTKIGLLLTVVSTVAPQWAQFDVRFAYVGAAAGALMMLWKEKPSA